MPHQNHMRHLMIWVACWVPGFAGLASDPGAVMFRGNPQHTGIYDGKGGFPVQKERWRFKTGNVNPSKLR